jgi:hypothetical protein
MRRAFIIAFRKFDTNADGKLTMAEFRMALHKYFSLNVNDDVVARLFRALDGQGGGSVTQAQFVHGFVQLRSKNVSNTSDSSALDGGRLMDRCSSIDRQQTGVGGNHSNKSTVLTHREEVTSARHIEDATDRATFRHLLGGSKGRSKRDEHHRHELADRQGKERQKKERQDNHGSADPTEHSCIHARIAVEERGRHRRQEQRLRKKNHDQMIGMMDDVDESSEPLSISGRAGGSAPSQPSSRRIPTPKVRPVPALARPTSTTDRSSSRAGVGTGRTMIDERALLNEMGLLNRDIEQDARYDRPPPGYSATNAQPATGTGYPTDGRRNNRNSNASSSSNSRVPSSHFSTGRAASAGPKPRPRPRPSTASTSTTDATDANVRSSTSTARSSASAATSQGSSKKKPPGSARHTPASGFTGLFQKRSKFRSKPKINCFVD